MDSKKDEHIMGNAWSTPQNDSGSPGVKGEPGQCAPGSTSGEPQKFCWGGKDWDDMKSYFEKIGYPPIVHMPRCVLILGGWHVYLVEFDPRCLMPGSSKPYQPCLPHQPCYAIIKDGVVSGYNEDFWTDADKYRLVLKQHLGMLALDELEHPKPKEVVPPKPEPRTVNPDTIEAIVGRYEGLVEELNKKIASQNKTIDAMAVSSTETIQRTAAILGKMVEISDILQGKKQEQQKKPEMTPVECAIFDDDNGIDDLVDEHLKKDPRKEPEHDVRFLHGIRDIPAGCN